MKPEPELDTPLTRMEHALQILLDEVRAGKINSIAAVGTYKDEFKNSDGQLVTILSPQGFPIPLYQLMGGLEAIKLKASLNDEMISDTIKTVTEES